MTAIVTPTKYTDRQYPLVACLEVGIAQIGAANIRTIALPPKALLLDVMLVTDTAFNSATTTTGTIGDGTTTFAAGVDLKTTGVETVTGVPKYYPNGGTLTVTLAETGAAATAGLAVVMARYVVAGRGIEQQY